MTARPMRPRSALPDLSALFDVEDDEEDPAFMDGKALPRPARRALRALSQGAGNKKERSSRRCRQQLLSAADFFFASPSGETTGSSDSCIAAGIDGFVGFAASAS